jgi:hypothetical protein
MTRMFPVLDAISGWRLAPDTPPVAAYPQELLVMTVVDEITGLPPEALAASTATTGLLARADADGLAGLAGVPLTQFLATSVTGAALQLTLAGLGYITLSRTATLPAQPGYPDAFLPANLNTVALHRTPVIIAGRVVNANQIPLDNALLTVNGIWSTLASLQSPPAAPNLIALLSPLYADRDATATIAAESLTAGAATKTLLLPGNVGDTTLRLSDQVGLAAGSIIGLDQHDPQRGEYVSVVSITQAGATPQQPATAVLPFPLARPHASGVASVSRINGYLIDGPQYAVPARTQPPAGRLKMHKGSQPTDGARLKKPVGRGYITTSNLILEDADRRQLLADDPSAKKWLKPFVGGDELISGQWRWCLWLKDADPALLRKSKAISERLDRVRYGRLKSPTESVKAYAKFPTLFTQDRQPDMAYLAIPEVSSETREYIPMETLPPTVIASNKLQIIPGAPLYYFAILTSTMHMAWMRTVCGRMKSDYSYAPAVYNSFPWPDMTPVRQKGIEQLAQAVLDVRASFPESTTLDDLYDADNMPPNLRRAHSALDKAVDRLYRRQGFAFERERVEHLFQLYEQSSAPLAPLEKTTRRKAI